MATLHRPKAHRTLSPQQELAYAICRSFYGSGGCACDKSGRDTICGNVQVAATIAERIITARAQPEKR